MRRVLIHHRLPRCRDSRDALLARDDAGCEAILRPSKNGIRQATAGHGTVPVFDEGIGWRRRSGVGAGTGGDGWLSRGRGRGLDEPARSPGASSGAELSHTAGLGHQPDRGDGATSRRWQRRPWRPHRMRVSQAIRFSTVCTSMAVLLSSAHPGTNPGRRMRARLSPSRPSRFRTRGQAEAQRTCLSRRASPLRRRGHRRGRTKRHRLVGLHRSPTRSRRPAGRRSRP